MFKVQSSRLGIALGSVNGQNMKVESQVTAFSQAFKTKSVALPLFASGIHLSRPVLKTWTESDQDNKKGALSPV